MEEMQYLDFGDNLVLIEKSICYPNQKGKIRYVNIQKYGEDEYIFDKIYCIFVFNKGSWLYFDTENQKTTLPIFDSSVDKVYLFAKVPNKCPLHLLGTKLNVLHLKQTPTQPIFRAIYVTINSLCQQNLLEICELISNQIGDDMLHKKIKTVSDLSRQLKIEGKEKEEEEVPGDTNILDLLYNLIDEPDTFFYPFHDNKKEFGFIPDSNFKVPFSKLQWKEKELTLFVTLPIPGVYRFPDNSHKNYLLPKELETYSTVTVNLIKNGKVSFDKLMISIPTNKGYLPLIKYPLILPEKMDVSVAKICKLVHQRNTQQIYYKLISFLQDYYCKSPQPFITKHKETFSILADAQKLYLQNYRITEEEGFIAKSSLSSMSFSFNVLEDELDTFSKCFERCLKNSLQAPQPSFPLVFDDFVNDMTAIIFEKIDNDPGNLNELAVKARRELSAYDYTVQQIRFYLSYNAPELLELEGKSELKVMHESFNFIFQLNRLGYSHVNQG
jgi:hypothetical protein